MNYAQFTTFPASKMVEKFGNAMTVIATFFTYIKLTNLVIRLFVDVAS